LILTFVNTLLLGWFVAGPQTGQIFKTQWEKWQAHRAEKVRAQALLAAQEKCLKHAFAPDLVIYDEDPDTARSLLTTRADYVAVSMNNAYVPPRWTPPALWNTRPDEWRDLITNAGNSYGESWQNLLFLGERRTPAGERMLVVVQLWPQLS